MPEAVIIGVGPGLGSLLARRLSGEGFAVTMVARNKGRLDDLADELNAAGGQVTAIAADAADSSTFEATLRELKTKAPSILVYNAALLRPSSIETVTAGDLATTYAVDVIGAVIAAQVFLPGMKAAGEGTIIFTSGSAAIRPSSGIATVSMGKAALRSAATMLAADVLDDNIQVVSITISGAIKAGTDFDPDAIADLYLKLHARPRDEWAAEEPFDGISN